MPPVVGVAGAAEKTRAQPLPDRTGWRPDRPLEGRGAALSEGVETVRSIAAIIVSVGAIVCQIINGSLMKRATSSGAI